MNPLLILIIMLLAVMLWLAISFSFITIGRLIMKIQKDLKNKLEYEEEEKMEKKEINE